MGSRKTTGDGPSPRGRWMALTAALLGWMFDGLEMGLFPLVARPALRDLLASGGQIPGDGQIAAAGMVGGPLVGAQMSQTAEVAVGMWFAVAIATFLIGAATGGVLFGWLGDRIGRVRAMTLSVLVYALFSGVCGLASEAWQVVAFRFVAAMGMGGEWSLGVALVMEVWPNRSRALMAGLIGAAANFGYMLIGVAALGLNVILADLRTGLAEAGMSAPWVAWLTANSGWRLLMLAGAIPALLTLFIQFFVPESGRWEAENRRGATSHWSTRDLAGVLLGAAAAGVLVVLWMVDVSMTVRVAGSLAALAVVTLGYLYPIFRYLGRAAAVEGETAVPRGATVRRMLLAAALSGVALLGTWGSVQWAPVWADKLTNGLDPNAKAYAQIAAAFGAILGCIVAALLGDLLGRRWTYALLCIGSLGAVLGLYRLNSEYGAVFLAWTFAAGAITAAFYGWLPLYLPELFRTSVRATGQGFGFNYGRIIAAVGVLQLPNLMRELNLNYPQACSAMSLIYIVGVVIIWLAPETKGKPLPA